MSKKYLSVLLSLILWPVSIFVSSQMQGYVSYFFWWMAHQANATRLTRSEFSLDSWLPLAAFNGTLLGLIPANHLRDWLASIFARFRQQLPTQSEPELNTIGPVLWAWVLPTAVFLIRFITFMNPGDQSILGETHYAPSRLSHFFGPPSHDVLSLDTLRWFNDRLFITAPMLFLLAYAATVLLRHHVSSARPSEGESVSPTDTLGS